MSGAIRQSDLPRPGYYGRRMGEGFGLENVPVIVSRATSPPLKGGLAPWQEKRALQMMAANLDGNVRLRSLAHEVGLSISQFSRAFRKSAGVPPHQWLLQRRVEAAKPLLKDRRLSLSEVALSVGFTDQSHFTRVFSAVVGMPPGLWRRRLVQ